MENVKTECAYRTGCSVYKHRFIPVVQLSTNQLIPRGAEILQDNPQRTRVLNVSKFHKLDL